MEKRIYLSPPNMSGYEMSYIQEAFDTNWIAPLGPQVAGFEKSIMDYTGAKYALALSSGTAAIHLALKALGVVQGDVVFCSTLTFAASCNPIMYEKATPVFIDSEGLTWNMDPECLRIAFEKYEALGARPKACIVVNLYGQSAQIKAIKELCDKYEVPMIEDAAESLGASYQGQKSGTFGKFGIFSFNGNKIITTSGGGMLVSEDEALINKCKFWATQAREDALHYEHKEVGYNYRMSNVCAGIGMGQMKVLDQFVAHKKKLYLRYKEAFKDIQAIEMMPIDENGESNYWLSVILIDPQSGVLPTHVIKKLDAKNIESRPVWKPMHAQPVFQAYDYITTLHISDQLFEEGLCLPSGSSLSDEEQDVVIGIIKSFFEGDANEV